jgi:hypothetical protein
MGILYQPAKGLLLLDWLSTRPDGVGIVRATGKSDRKPCINDGLHNVFHYWRTFRTRCVAVVPNQPFCCDRIFRESRSDCIVGAAPLTVMRPSGITANFKDGWRWLLLRGLSCAKDTGIRVRSNVRTTAIGKLFWLASSRESAPSAPGRFLVIPLGQARLSNVSYCIESILSNLFAQPLCETRNNHNLSICRFHYETIHDFKSWRLVILFWTTAPHTI